MDETVRKIYPFSMTDLLRTLLPHTFVFVAASLIVAGCSHATHFESEVRPAAARLTTAEAVRIAREAAEREGSRLSDYKPPEAHYDYTRKDKTWWVFFAGRVAAPGNDFFVSVDDQSGKTRVIPGM